eukprot:1138838-Pelagomonas_calceolata.AAC.11
MRKGAVAYSPGHQDPIMHLGALIFKLPCTPHPVHYITHHASKSHTLQSVLLILFTTLPTSKDGGCISSLCPVHCPMVCNCAHLLADTPTIKKGTCQQQEFRVGCCAPRHHHRLPISFLPCPQARVVDQLIAEAPSGLS